MTAANPPNAQPAVHLAGAAWRPDGNGGAVLLPDVCTAMEAASYLRLACDTPEAARKAMGRVRQAGLVRPMSHGRGRPLLFLREDLVKAAKRLWEASP